MLCRGKFIHGNLGINLLIYKTCFRLRKGRELETERDVKEVQRDLALIKSPAAGLKQRQDQQMAEDNKSSESETEEQMEGIIEDGGEVTL